MTMRLLGGVYLSGGRDKEGYRVWNVKHLVLSDVVCGPSRALRCPGLPAPGDMYLFDDDEDPYAFCTLEAKVTPYSNSPKTRAYWVEQPFSSAPNTKWCKDQQIDDPLLQPPKISGNFIRYSEEATYDRFGNPLMNSAWEQIRGPQVEFDADRIQIEIEQNVIYLNLPLLIAMSNTVNIYPIWGAGPRIIKFTPGQWSMNFYGMCHKYFTRKLIFEGKKDGWDRVILDEGTKALKGHWDQHPQGVETWVLDRVGGNLPNPRNPTHFVRYKDRLTENTRTILDGAGKPWVPINVTAIEDCPGSPTGAPTVWMMNGFVHADGAGTPVILNYTGVCIWTADWQKSAGVFLAVTLRYFPVDPPGGIDYAQWKLTIASIPGTWIDPAILWKPAGPNMLTWNNSNDLFAEAVLADPDIIPVITLTTGSRPGVRYIQKYEGSDFLLLGVPLLF